MSDLDNNSPMRRVVIAEMYINDYRLPFYNHLRALLAQERIELNLLTGVPSRNEAKKRDQATLGWEIQIPCTYLAGERLCWLPFGSYAQGADLVIVTQENKLLFNLWLLSLGRPRRLAFWGHGRNMQASKPNGWKENFKRWTTNKVDWWFAYTEATTALLGRQGFPGSATTTVNNSVDTRKLAALCQTVSPIDCQRMRRRLGLDHGPLGLYLGSLHKMKRFDFLLEAARRIRSRIPDFQLLIAGAGPMQADIEAAAREQPWIRYAGPLVNLDKAVALRLADVLLNPGAVGLGILDSFVSGTPLITTECATHGPEIAYLRSMQNGVMTANDIDAYCAAIISLLTVPEQLAKLQAGALASAAQYTIEKMAASFTEGIVACLSTRGKSAR